MVESRVAEAERLWWMGKNRGGGARGQGKNAERCTNLQSEVISAMDWRFLGRKGRSAVKKRCVVDEYYGTNGGSELIET